MTVVASFGSTLSLGLETLNRAPEAARSYILELGNGCRRLTKKSETSPINCPGFEGFPSYVQN